MYFRFLPIFIMTLLLSPSGYASSYCDSRKWSSAEVISVTKEDLSRPNRRYLWEIKASDSFGVFSISVSSYRPTKIQRNFWDQKENPDNLMIFPTIDGESVLESQLARYFSARGFYVAIVSIEEVKGEFDHLTACRMDGMYRRIQDTSLIVHDMLNKVNPDGRFFTLGASQGGIRSLIAAEVIPNLSAVWANVPGGDFPSIYAESTVDDIASFREQHMQALDIDDTNVYEGYLREHLILDPLDSCANFEAPLSLVIATEDSSVPTYNQLLLLKSCPEAQYRKIDSGHFIGVINLFFNRREVRHFFEAY